MAILGNYAFSSMDMTEMYDIAREIAELYRQNIKMSGVTASGSLERFTWNFQYKNNSFILTYDLPEHWKWVEEGRNPTKDRKTKWRDPIGDITKWMRLKKIAPRPMYKRTKKGNVRYIPTEKQMAFMIVRKIHKRGWYDPNHQGKHLLRNSLQMAEDDGLIQELVNVIAKRIEKEIEVNMNSIINEVN